MTFRGSFLGSRELFVEKSRVRGCVHGHFFRRFHRHFRVRSRAFFWKFSRALFAVHGHFFSKSNKKTQNLDFHGQFSQVDWHFFLKTFTGKFEFHGHFWGSRARLFPIVHGQKQNIHEHFCEICHGHFFGAHAGKKNTDLGGGGGYWNRVPITPPSKSLTNTSAAQLFYKETLTRYLEEIKFTDAKAF